MQLYRPRSKTAHRALQALSQLFAVLCRCRVAGASSYTAPPASRRTLYRPAQPPYYNKVYKKGSGSSPVMDPCQTVQQIADHASPAASRYSPRPAAGDLAPGQPGTLHPAGQSSSRGAAGGAEPLTAVAVFIFGLSPDS